MQYLRVKNWDDFQHYKDRSPPWIKLHRDLLRDYNFICLQDASKLQLVLIWLLASQLDNKIPADAEYIKNQIGIKGELNLKELIEHGFLIDDSNTLAECKQSAIVETETEAYRTDREDTDILAETVVPLPREKNACRLDVWMKREGMDDIPHDWGMWASTEHALPDSDINSEWMKFTDYWKANGTANARKKDWQAAWRTWIRNSIEYKSRRK